jgi:hypothetical protein
VLALSAVVAVVMSGVVTTSSATQTTASQRPSAGFRLQSVGSGLCLDIRAGNPWNGASVAMWSCMDWSSQRWHWNGVQLQSDVNNRCLDVADGNLANGGDINMWDCGGQVWSHEGDQTLRIGGKCLDVSAGNNGRGAAVQIWECHSGAHQRWRVIG